MPETAKKRVRAAHNYDAENPDELSFQKGDLIEILAQPVDDPWWSGRLVETGEEGLFPSNFVKDIEPSQPGNDGLGDDKDEEVAADESAEQQQSPLDDKTDEHSSESKQDERVPIATARVIEDYAKQEGEISLRKGDIVTIYERLDDGYYFGENNGHEGRFPSKYVEETNQTGRPDLGIPIPSHGNRSQVAEGSAFKLPGVRQGGIGSLFAGGMPALKKRESSKQVPVNDDKTTETLEQKATQPPAAESSVTSSKDSETIHGSPSSPPLAKDITENSKDTAVIENAESTESNAATSASAKVTEETEESNSVHDFEPASQEPVKECLEVEQPDIQSKVNDDTEADQEEPVPANDKPEEAESSLLKGEPIIKGVKEETPALDSEKTSSPSDSVQSMGEQAEGTPVSPSRQSSVDDSTSNSSQPKSETSTSEPKAALPESAPEDKPETISDKTKPEAKEDTPSPTMKNDDVPEDVAAGKSVLDNVVSGTKLVTPSRPRPNRRLPTKQPSVPTVESPNQEEPTEKTSRTPTPEEDKGCEESQEETVENNNTPASISRQIALNAGLTGRANLKPTSRRPWERDEQAQEAPRNEQTPPPISEKPSGVRGIAARFNTPPSLGSSPTLSETKMKNELQKVQKDLESKLDEERQKRVALEKMVDQLNATVQDLLERMKDK